MLSQIRTTGLAMRYSSSEYPCCLTYPFFLLLQPDILSVYLFDYTSRPDLTQTYARQVLEYWFTNDSDGIPGNDGPLFFFFFAHSSTNKTDYGTMSAWALFTSLGFYPNPPSTTYLLGSPVVNRAIVQLPSGTLTIVAHNNSMENVYVEKVLVNGTPLTTPFLPHTSLLQQNATIEFFMSSQPQKPF
jgi:putative alpha-1,2-mannosidase